MIHGPRTSVSSDLTLLLRRNPVSCLLATFLCAAAALSGCSGLFQTSPEHGVVVVHPDVSYQSFVGWQASGETGLTDNVSSGKLYRDAVVDAAVELGINRVRIGLGSGMAENSVDYFQNFIDKNEDAGGPSPPAEYAASIANRRVPVNDNDDPNTISPAGFTWGAIDWEVDNVVLPLKSKLAEKGERLWWAVSYVHFSKTNQLHIDSPLEYGELILATWDHIQMKYGIVPDGLEICLEPDNEVIEVTEEELAAMIVAARDRLIEAGYEKPTFTAPSSVYAPNALPYYEKIKAANPVAASYIDEIGYHRYKSIDDAGLAKLRSRAEADGKMTAMTEFAGATYLELHQDLKIGKVSAWEQFALGYPTDDNGYQYFYVTGSNPNFVVNMGSRTKFLRQYMKFIRAGAVMKGATSSDPNFDGLPFQNLNGTYVMPIKFEAEGVLTVENLPAGTYGIKYTTESEYDVDLPNQTIPAGGAITFNMPATGVATIYDVRFSSQSRIEVRD